MLNPCKKSIYAFFDGEIEAGMVRLATLFLFRQNDRELWKLCMVVFLCNFISTTFRIENILNFEPTLNKDNKIFFHLCVTLS